jgi:spore coat polysaccharide biosynthesis protein SpsF (cytidylyltransferase family)
MKVKALRADVMVRLTSGNDYIFVGKDIVEVPDTDDLKAQVEGFVKSGVLAVDEDNATKQSFVEEISKENVDGTVDEVLDNQENNGDEDSTNGKSKNGRK